MTTPPTAIARTVRGDDAVVVELVDLAGDDEVLGRIRAALPAGRGAVLESWSGDPASEVRLFEALADDLRAAGRLRLTRTFGSDDQREADFLAALGFVPLRVEDGTATWVWEL